MLEVQEETSTYFSMLLATCFASPLGTFLETRFVKFPHHSVDFCSGVHSFWTRDKGMIQCREKVLVAEARSEGLGGRELWMQEMDDCHVSFYAQAQIVFSFLSSQESKGRLALAQLSDGILRELFEVHWNEMLNERLRCHSCIQAGRSKHCQWSRHVMRRT